MRGYSLTRTPRHSLCRTPLRTGTPREERGNKGSPTEANACCVSTPGRTLRLLVSLPLGDSQRQPSGLRWHTLCPVADRPYFRWGGRNIPSESMALGSHQAKVETVAFWGEPCSVTVAQITWVLRLLAAQAAKCFKATAFQSGDAWSTLRAEGGLAGWAAAHPGSRSGSVRHSGRRAVHRQDPPRHPRVPPLGSPHAAEEITHRHIGHRPCIRNTEKTLRHQR